MSIRSVQMNTDRTPEDLARIKSLREKYQKEKPSLGSLIEANQGGEPLPLGAYLEMKELLGQLKTERENAGLSLADVAAKTGMDRASISRLENGHQENPTVETLARYATAIGKRLVWSFVDGSRP